MHPVELFIELITGLIPFLIFLDFNKKRNIHKAVIYLVVFFISFSGIITANSTGLLRLSLATPVLLVIYLLISRILSQGK